MIRKIFKTLLVFGVMLLINNISFAAATLTWTGTRQLTQITEGNQVYFDVSIAGLADGNLVKLDVMPLDDNLVSAGNSIPISSLRMQKADGQYSDYFTKGLSYEYLNTTATTTTEARSIHYSIVAVGKYPPGTYSTTIEYKLTVNGVLVDTKQFTLSIDRNEILEIRALPTNPTLRITADDVFKEDMRCVSAENNEIYVMSNVKWRLNLVTSADICGTACKGTFEITESSPGVTRGAPPPLIEPSKTYEIASGDATINTSTQALVEKFTKIKFVLTKRTPTSVPVSGKAENKFTYELIKIN